MAKTAIDFLSTVFSPDGWISFSTRESEEIVRGHIKAMNSSFTRCVQDGIPFQEKLVAAFSNCPAQVLKDYVGSLSDDFRDAVNKAEVNKAWDFRFANPDSTERLRILGDMRERQRSAKRQKT